MFTFYLFTGAGLCSDFLLPTIPDSHLAASSSLNIAGSNGYTGPDRARLDTKQTTLGNTTILMGGWAPGSDNKGQYIQVSTGPPLVIVQCKGMDGHLAQKIIYR